jgi:hypothetical protein
LPPLGELKKLEIFRAEHNNISAFPDVRGCALLRELHLSGNSIMVMLHEIIQVLVYKVPHENFRKYRVN